MYTEVRGFIKLRLDIGKEEKEKKKVMEIINGFKGKSERSEQCIFCTIFHQGFNWEYYLFIGGSIKNYDNDWEKYINYLKDNLKISSAFLEERYEENDNYTTILSKLEDDEVRE